MERALSEKTVPRVTGTTQSPAPMRTSAERQRRQFLEEIENYVGEDPLDPWIRYIKWLSENDRDGGNRSQIKPVLEYCTQKFQNDPRYRRDRRYLLLWVQYADFCPDPSSVFAFLEENDIGQDHAIFYRAYAMSLEVHRNFSKAYEIYRVGIQRSAQPLGRLESVYKDFLTRMLKRGERKFGKIEQEDELSFEELRFRLWNEKHVQLAGHANSPGTRIESEPAKEGNVQYPITWSDNKVEQQEAPSFEELRLGRWNDKRLKRSGDAEGNTTELAKSTNMEAGQSALVPRVNHDIDTAKEHQLSIPATGRIGNSAHAPHVALSSKCSARVIDYENCFSGEADSSSQVFHQQKAISDITNLGNDINACQTKVLESSKASGSVVSDCHRELRKPILTLPVGEGAATNASVQGDETVAIARFAELSVMGSDPKMNGSDAVLHQGLVDPTITTKEALADILDMFSKPLHCHKSMSKTKNAQDRKKFLGNSASFEIFEDEGIDLNSPAKPKNTRDGKKFPSSSASFEIFTDEGLDLRAPAKPKLANDRKTSPGSSSRFEIFADDGIYLKSPARSTRSHEDGKVFSQRLPGDSLAQKLGLHTIQEETSGGRKHEGSHNNVESASRPPDSRSRWDCPEKENVVVQSAENLGPVSDMSEAKLSKTKIALAPVDLSSGFQDLSRIKADVLSVDLPRAHTQRSVFHILEDELSAQKISQLSRDGGEFEGFTGGSFRDQSTRIDDFSRSSLSASERNGRSQAKSTHILVECDRDGLKLNEVDDFRVDAALAAAEDVPDQDMTVEGTGPVLQPRTFPAGRNVSAQAEPKTVDPWDESYVQGLLTRVKPLMANYKGYFGSSEKYSGPIPSSLLRSSNGHNKILQLGSCAYHLKRCIGKGAYAQVFEVDQDQDLSVGATQFACKFQRPACPWEFYIYRQLDMRISEERSSFGQVRSFHLYSDCSFMICDYGANGTLQDVVNAYLSRGQRMDEVLCMYYTIRMIRMLEVLHGAGIIHADIKPDNILIHHDSQELKAGTGDWPGRWKSTGLSLIDWGRSIDITLHPEETLFKGDCRTDKFRCPEMLEDRPWRFQVDTFGLCGVVHCLLHGSYMRIRKFQKEDGHIIYQPSSAYRRYWNVKLWRAFFETLINVGNVGVDAMPLKVLRRAFEDHVKTNSLAKKVNELLAKQSSMMLTK